MKLRISTKLLYPLLGAFLSLASPSFAENSTISINFGTSALPSTATGQVGGIDVNGWMNITGANTGAVNGNHTLTDQSNQTVGNLVLNTPQNPWGPTGASKDTLEHAIQSSYLDLSASNGYTISFNTDFQFSNLVLYLSGDNGKFAPINVNGTDYIGGTDTEGSDAWGTRTNGTSFNDSNTITVTGLNGEVTLSNVIKNNSGVRATLAGMQIIDSTSDFTYSATLNAGSNLAANQTWTKGGTTTNLSDIALADRLMYITAAAEGSSLDLQDNAFTSINVKSGKLTLTSSTSTPLTVGTLWASSGSEITIDGTLNASTPLATGGTGSIIFTSNQTLSGLSGTGSIHLGTGITLTMNGTTGSSFSGNIHADNLAQIVKNDQWNMEGNFYIKESGNYVAADLTSHFISQFNNAKGFYLGGDNTITWSTGTLANTKFYAAEGGKITYIKTGTGEASMANLTNVEYINITQGTLKIDGIMANVKEMHISDGAILKSGYSGGINNASTQIFMQGGSTISAGSGNYADHKDYNASFIVDGSNGKAVNFLGSTFGNEFSFNGTITGKGTVRFAAGQGDNQYKVGATISDKSGTEKIALLFELGAAQNLIINGHNTYSGGSTINSGVIQANTATAFGSGKIELNGGQLNMNGQALNNNLVYNGGSFTNYGNFTGILTAKTSCNLTTNFHGGLDLTYGSVVTMTGTAIEGTSLFNLASLNGGAGSLFFELSGIEENQDYVILTVGNTTTNVNWDTITWDSNYNSNSHFWQAQGNTLTLKAIPEPSSALMSLLGLTALVIYRRRR